MHTTRQWEIQNSMFRTPVHCFCRLLKGSKQAVRVIEGNIIEMICGETKLLRVSGRFQLPGVKLQ